MKNNNLNPMARILIYGSVYFFGGSSYEISQKRRHTLQEKNKELVFPPFNQTWDEFRASLIKSGKNEKDYPSYREIEPEYCSIFNK